MRWKRCWAGWRVPDVRSSITLLILLTAVGIAEASVITEAEAVRRGLSQPNVHALLDARRGVAAGNAKSAGRWNNPEIEYKRETLDLAGGSGEDREYWVRQRLNLAGVHGLERDAAAQMHVAADARTELVTREIAADIRVLFYESMAADAEAKAIADWHDRLGSLAGAAADRVAAGDASRYDQLRLERELALVRGDLLNAQATAGSARDRLFSLIGGEPGALQGRLLPPALDDVVLADVLENHPLLAALDAESSSATLSATAARRKRWPEVTVGVGRREVSEPGFDADGSGVSLNMTIPLFDRGAGAGDAANSRAQQFAAESALTKSRLAADIRATLRALAAYREGTLALGGVDVNGPDSLAAIAESAYAAGEIGVVELIDAHRTELAAQRESFKRALAARNTFIQLQLLTGDHP